MTLIQIDLVVHQDAIGKGIARGLKLVLKNIWQVTVFSILLTLITWSVINLGTIFTLFLHQIPLGFDSYTLRQIQSINSTPAIQIWVRIHGVITTLFTYSASIAFYNAISQRDRKMEVIRYLSPTRFLQQVQPFLESHEAANSLILGIALRLADHPEWTEQPPYLGAVLSDTGSVLLAGLITPPHNLLLAGAENVPPEALALLAEHLRSGGWSFPAVHAANPLAVQFAQVWTQQTGKGTRLQMRQLIYQLDQVIPPNRSAAGELRQAMLSDLDLSFAWRAAFIQESLHTQPLPGLRDELRHQIEAGLVYLWLDGEPVSTAVTTRPTPHGMSISGVYTPPALRGRGYASACVTALSRQILDGGKRFCTLFTDADYPASNAIYQAIGYRPIGEFSVFEFEQ